MYSDSEHSFLFHAEYGNLYALASATPYSTLPTQYFTASDIIMNAYGTLLKIDIPEIV